MKNKKGTRKEKKEKKKKHWPASTTRTSALSDHQDGSRQ